MPTTTTSCAVDYHFTGSGPGLLLIHGTGADAESSWTELIDSVAARFTTVAINLPGSGRTPVSPEPLDIVTLADQAAATAVAAGLTDFHVVGHSLGAVIATAVAARHGARVRSLVAHAAWTRSGAREAFQFGLWESLLRADPELLARHLQLTAMGPATLASRTAEDFEQAVAGFTEMLGRQRLQPLIELDARVDIRSLLHSITAPSLVLASRDDQIVPVSHQRELARAIPGAGYLELPGGHALPFEDPAAFTAAIADWLDYQESALGSSHR
ncbi:alpha/beta fold hydrolase [Saccharopolyspora elongata]|uniref:Alpha/beta hydrolase n=1 Tax=Saccharopolyspora elongata TaxID=2530387 RepID=A0A4R4YZP5_9PSEU|nr:alpha/beta hydrolase [Saccharopolyspora elongata]TDD50500.1 alpha/beta hydrolase [Saccharopolyspora elongata]